MPAHIFGRDAELGTIGAFIGRLPRSPGALVLAGPAGAGKTTLLKAGAALADEHAITVLGTTPARIDLRLAFAGLADLLEPFLGALIGELPPPQARALRVALLLQTAQSHPEDPRVIAAAFRTTMNTLAHSGPVLLVIDDVQWLDSPSAAAMGFAVRRLEHEQVGLLCAHRTARPDAELPLELDRGRIPTVLLPVGGLVVLEAGPETVAATISVGGLPDAVAVSPDGSVVYLADASGHLDIIDVSTRHVISVKVGGAPEAVAAGSDGSPGVRGRGRGQDVVRGRCGHEPDSDGGAARPRASRRRCHVTPACSAA